MKKKLIISALALSLLEGCGQNERIDAPNPITADELNAEIIKKAQEKLQEEGLPEITPEMLSLIDYKPSEHESLTTFKILLPNESFYGFSCYGTSIDDNISRLSGKNVMFSFTVTSDEINSDLFDANYAKTFLSENIESLSNLTGELDIKQVNTESVKDKNVVKTVSLIDGNFVYSYAFLLEKYPVLMVAYTSDYSDLASIKTAIETVNLAYNSLGKIK